MLTDVQNIIKKIEEFLSDKPDYETVTHDNGTIIQVFYKDFDPIVYHGYELYLLELVSKMLNSELKYNITDHDGMKYFTITTNAIFNIESAISNMNKKSTKLLTDEICGVFICISLENKDMGYSVLTTCYDGNWMRYDMTKAELIYALFNKFELSLIPSDNKVLYVFEDIIKMHQTFYDELEKSKNIEKK